MVRIKGAVLLALVAAAGGCASEGTLDIRPVGRQAAGGETPSARILIAQGQLALGNVALALEGFRRAKRDEPGSIAALAGMAECYRQMGRIDLSRRYYEEALALAPQEPRLYVGLAGVIEGEGDSATGRSLRQEAATRAAGLVPPASPAVAPPVPTPSAASVTIALAPARPAAAPRARLERLSSGEVALVTGGASPWVARAQLANARKVTVQYEKRTAMVVLNAARVQGIAARTRDYLAARGFSATRIGNAPTVVAQSIIRFPDGARDRAARIAAQFSVAPRLEQAAGPLTLIVGRDAAAQRGRNAG